jgi:RNA polymerase sigma-70 factor, ECF subfamily
MTNELTGMQPQELDFPALYEQCVDRIYRYHLARTGDSEVAEDLTAETYRAALELRGGYQDLEGPPISWLAGIARRKLADFLRRGNRGRAEQDRQAQWTVSGRPEASEALRLLEIAQVAQVLRAMPADRAEAVALHFFAGMDVVDVALVMGRSVEVIHKVMERGLGDLQDRLLAAREVKR